MSTIKDLLETGKGMLLDSSDTPYLDAEVLLSAVTGLGRASLISKSQDSVGREIEARYLDLIERRKKHEPVAYLIGKKEFFGLEFLVDSHVLIPRPETELLVEMAIPVCYRNKHKSLILDLGTGSGCISVSLAHELKKFHLDFEIVAVDNNENALNIAQSNIEKHGLTSYIKTLKSNWFDALSEYEGAFDLIVTNPPYIAVGDKEISPETNFEPQQALYSGPAGLDSIEYLLENARRYLKPEGFLMSEIGYQQRGAVQAICDNKLSKNGNGYNISFTKDLAGLDRAFEICFH